MTWYGWLLLGIIILEIIWLSLNINRLTGWIYTLAGKNVIIDEIDVDDVQMMIIAVNGSSLNAEEKVRLHKMLDRWTNALSLTKKIRITF